VGLNAIPDGLLKPDRLLLYNWTSQYDLCCDMQVDVDRRLGSLRSSVRSEHGRVQTLSTNARE
jgi:hypothetical protein